MLHSPTMLLLLPGSLCWALGLLLALPIAFGPIEISGRNIDIHFMILTGLANILGLQVVTIGVLSKAYAHLSGLRDDPMVARLYRWFTFEKAFMGSIAIALAGLLIAGWVVIEWMASGFGALNRARVLFFALLLLVNGSQMGLAAYLFSIMALPRHIDSLPPEIEQTGISDV
jgi:hypothetical protein